MRGFRGIQAVTFDAGGTLIAAWPSVGHVYADIAARHGFKDLSAGVLNRRFATAWADREECGHTPVEWGEIMDATFAGLVPENVVRGFFPELYQRFAEASAWRIYDDVMPTVEALARRGFKLAVISNWDERLRPLLGNLDLGRHFAALVISAEVGCRKPSLEIFYQAAAMLDLPPQAILHVGDSAEEDFTGARAAGFRAALLNRNGDSAATPGIRRLTELTSSLT